MRIKEIPCPHCKEINRIDLDNLDGTVPGARLLEDKHLAPGEEAPAFIKYRIECNYCFKPFTIKIPREGGNG